MKTGRWMAGLVIAGALAVGASGPGSASDLPGQGEDVPGQIGITGVTPEEAVPLIAEAIQDEQTLADQAVEQGGMTDSSEDAAAAQDVARFYQSRVDRMTADLQQLCRQLAEDGVWPQGCAAPGASEGGNS